MIGPKRLSNRSRHVAPATIGEIMTGSTSSATKICRPGHAVQEQQRQQQAEHQLERQRDARMISVWQQSQPEPRVREQPRYCISPRNEVSSSVMLMFWTLTISV